MESVNTSKASGREMQQDQSSRQRKKLTFIITFAVVFSLIICSIIAVLAIIKNDMEADGLSANPFKAIHAVCSLTPNSGLCSRSLSDYQAIYPSKTTSPSKILTLSLHAAIKQLQDLISTTRALISQIKNSRNLSALKECEILFKDSMRLLNKTVEIMDQVNPDENLFKENKSIIRVFQVWMTNATENLDKCLNGTEYMGLNTSGDNDEVGMMMNINGDMIRFGKSSMKNSLTILLKMDEILELFDPRFGSDLAAFFSEGFGYIVAIFSSQYLVLVILIVLVLRLYY